MVETEPVITTGISIDSGTSKKSNSDAGKNDASHNEADEGENFQGAPSAGLDSTSSGVTDITSDIAPSDMREVNLKAQHESREDTRGIHSPRESDVIESLKATRSPSQGTPRERPPMMTWARTMG